MVQTSGSSERTAFSRWLQTGTVPSALGSDGLERKFNPWYDPAGGRFTFVGAGRRYGYARGVDGTGSEDWPARSTQPKLQYPASSATPNGSTRSTSPLNSSAPSAASAPGTGAEGGFTGGGGGNSGGAGATGACGLPEPQLRPRSSSGSAAAFAFSGGPVAMSMASTRLASKPSEQFRTVVRNGYNYR